jgi:CBS domain-containing protein
MHIKDIMSRDVTHTHPGATLQEAAAKMKAIDVGLLPVCDHQRLIGMITDRDITLRATAEGESPVQIRVGDIMTEEVISCFEDQDVAEAARLMEDKQIRRLPVLNRNRRLVGIVSLGDLAVEGGDERLAGKALEEVSKPARPCA